MTGKTDEPTKKKPTERLGVREIAKRVGVAPMTVSRVLSNPDMVSPETRAKVLKAIEDAGFVPNRLASSMRGSGRMIGTVVRNSGEILCCGTCIDARGIREDMLVDGARRSTMEELADRTLAADKTLVF